MNTLPRFGAILLLAAPDSRLVRLGVTLVDAARKGDAQAVRVLLQRKTVDVNAAAIDGTNGAALGRPARRCRDDEPARSRRGECAARR